MYFCNWCYKPLQKGLGKRPYCDECSVLCKRECIRCHRPFRDLTKFVGDSKVCIVCEKKSARQKKMSGAEIPVVQDVATSSSDCDSESSEDGEKNARGNSKMVSPGVFSAHKSSAAGNCSSTRSDTDRKPDSVLAEIQNTSDSATPPAVNRKRPRKELKQAEISDFVEVKKKRAPRPSKSDLKREKYLAVCSTYFDYLSTPSPRGQSDPLRLLKLETDA